MRYGTETASELVAVPIFRDCRAHQDCSRMRRKIVADAGATREGRPGRGLMKCGPWYRAEPPKRFGIDPVVLCNAVG